LTVPALWHFCRKERISRRRSDQIADQIESYRNSIVEQLKVQQASLQLMAFFDNIRNYLNSLERPELNPEGIKQDFQKLLMTPSWI